MNVRVLRSHGRVGRLLAGLGVLTLALAGKACGKSAATTEGGGACLWSSPHPAGSPCGAGCPSDCTSALCASPAGATGTASVCCASIVPLPVGSACGGDCVAETPTDSASQGDAIECAAGKCTCKPGATSPSCRGTTPDAGVATCEPGGEPDAGAACMLPDQYQCGPTRACCDPDRPFACGNVCYTTAEDAASACAGAGPCYACAVPVVVTTGPSWCCETSSDSTTGCSGPAMPNDVCTCLANPSGLACAHVDAAAVTSCDVSYACCFAITGTSCECITQGDVDSCYGTGATCDTIASANGGSVVASCPLGSIGSGSGSGSTSASNSSVGSSSLVNSSSQRSSLPSTSSTSSPETTTTTTTTTTAASSAECAPTCTTNRECADSCPALEGAVSCCDPATSLCYSAVGAACPSPPKDAGAPDGSVY